MFEPPQDKSESRSGKVWIGASIIAALVVVVTLLYMMSRPGPKAPARVQSPTPAPNAPPPDPVHDLQIIRASMGRDTTGTRVMCALMLRNRSTVYAYNDMQYEVSYIGADGKSLAVNRGTIKDSIEPGEEKNVPEFMNGLYAIGTARYQFVLTDAKATAR